MRAQEEFSIGSVDMRSTSNGSIEVEIMVL